ncbi:LacI family DNA-binding transcriptional regulator [Puniceicoccus vermicola]|uniref:LacI family DNA-binding transcriptional regulator n=1 Tax=Puniceicoccus vermicola TaxID=388746 RepID=A0A7X1AYY8_9BACT|nr:LacI family DNA-binding transcriptional regulator [Puniceicoccus vermicola]MBC2602561.1 LacI family DNA-binding transcriptional regulator [Puniceicoccus vermicola]
MAIGLRQLAEICNVSHTTVSRALKDDPRISKTVKARIQKIAETYNYMPNRLVKGVMSGKSQCIAVVLADSTRDVGGILGPIQQYFLRKSFSTFVYNTQDDPKLELLSFHEAACHRVEGLIVAPADQNAKDPYFKELRRYEIPFVIIGPNVEQVEAPHVAADDQASTMQIVDHLSDLGHRNIALMRGSMPHESMDKRYLGYLQAMQKHDHPVNLNWICQSGWTPEESDQSVQQLMRNQPKPTAIVCVNDSIAMGAIRGLKQLGLRVPQDISVTGMGDDYFSQYLSPALTTTSSVRGKVGQEAAKRLWQMIEKPSATSADPANQVLLPVELIVRESTGPVSSRKA